MKLNNRGALDGIVILLIVLVFGMVGYILYDNFSDNKDSDSKTAQSSDEQIQSIKDRNADLIARTNINAIHGQLEAFHENNNRYPSESEFYNGQWLATNLPGAPTDSIKYVVDRSGGSTYSATPKDCSKCTDYVISVILSNGSEYRKQSLN